MINLFLPYELGNKLKDLGFNEPCVGIFTMGNTAVMCSGATVAFNNTHAYYKDHCAILIQQAFQWFREKHMKSPRFCIDTNGWYFTITQFTESGSSLTDSQLAPLAKQDYKTYEEAELACINKMIELIQK